MNSFKPLAIVAILAAIGVGLYLKINSMPAPEPPPDFSGSWGSPPQIDMGGESLGGNLIPQPQVVTVSLDAVGRGTKLKGLVDASTGPREPQDLTVTDNDVTGALSYDADCAGGAAAVQFATLSPGLALTYLDFFVIA